MSETPPEMRSWKSRLITRVVHSYFAFARGMTMGVRAACFDAEGRVFLVRHSYVPGWHMPGGGLERGETALQALVKELREEGNLEMSGPPELFHVYYNRQTSKRDHVIFYRCLNVRQVSPKKPDMEIVESGFFALDDLPAATTPATRRRLAELSGSAPPADVW
ncbi:NUDIX domain-containing protein [Pararhizobium sp.]|uniref:NUDIX domain-containing protein n=1 Tax=Pararhizobium sp. TaxID=1977563 RepID=UPI003D14D5DB